MTDHELKKHRAQSWCFENGISEAEIQTAWWWLPPHLLQQLSSEYLSEGVKKMDGIKKAVEYFKDAVSESDEIIGECSDNLKAELTKQKGYFVVALTALENQIPKPVIPNKRIPELCKCPICKTELCRDDKDLHYCPTCGQALQV